MSNSAYSEINFHITWHTKTSLPMINERIESRLYHYLTHKILETPGALLHALGGIETHIHIAASLQPNILVSDWIGKLKGSSSYYINHEVQPKGLEWQRGYGIVTFGTKDMQWVVDYVNNQKEHHKNGTIRDRLEKSNHALKVRGYLPFGKATQTRLKLRLIRRGQDVLSGGWTWN